MSYAARQTVGQVRLRAARLGSELVIELVDFLIGHRAPAPILPMKLTREWLTVRIPPRLTRYPVEGLDQVARFSMIHAV